MPADGSATVEHVRLKRAQVEAPVARLRLSYLFSSVQLQPEGMPPSAVLVVRSMHDPLPGRIAMDFASAATPSAEWQTAAQARLAALYRRAARPASGAVPGTAEAVLFADFGELLACLALDLCAGAGNSWWWKSILRRHSSRLAAAAPNAWADVWAEHPRYVSAALQQLHERGQASRVLEKTSPADAWRLLLAVARAFGLPASAFQAAGASTAMRSRPEPGAPSLAGQQPLSSTPNEEGQSDRNPPLNPQDPAARPPWERYVGASSLPARLGPERRALLGVSLLLRHAPQQASSAAFALQLSSWLAQERESLSPAPATRPETPPLRRTPPIDRNLASEMRAILFSESEAATRSEPARPASDIVPAAPEREMSAASAPHSASHPPAYSPETAFTEAETAKADTHETPLSSHAIERQSPERLRRHFENGCRTALGGVFYLVHLVLKSGLLEFNIGLRGWALLELLARCLLDGVSADVLNDPVWDALALLDCRDPGTHPEAGFEPQHTYQAPQSWFRNLDTTQRLVRFRSNRMELWHPGGFLTFDSQEETLDRGRLVRSSRLNRQQRRAWSRSTRVCPIGLTPSPQLRRFLRFILPFARWRLGQALRGASLGEILLRKATLYVTRTHVDLVMGMRQISVPARLAGLDANPGWVPELGRVINFHFGQEGFGYE